jgi:hypothetical protein
MKTTKLLLKAPGNHHSRKKGYWFGVSREQSRSSTFLTKNTKFPGPGFYNPKDSPPKGFKISGHVLKPSYIGQSMIESLGPGFYDLEQIVQLSVHRSESKYSFARNTEERLVMARSRLRVPGPGHYSVESASLSHYQRSPKFRLSQTLRLDITAGRLLECPGPGAYECGSSFGKIEDSPKLARYASKKSLRKKHRNKIDQP